MSQSTFTGFKPERGLPWFSRSMEGLSPEQIKHKMQGCLSFCFDTPSMAPAFPVGTCVVLRPVKCRCKIEVGKVYVLLDKARGLIACGRLSEARECDELTRWGTELTLQWEDGRIALEPWVWPHPGYCLYALAYYGSVAVEAL